MRSDENHFRRLTAGTCMVAGPLFLLAAVIVAPRFETDEAAFLRETAAHADRQYISTVLVFFGFVLLLGAVLGLTHMLRERSTRLGRIGGGLAALGIVTILGLFFGTSLMQWQMGKGGADREQMVALLERFNDSGGLLPFFILTIGFTVGFFVLAVGLYRAHAVHRISAALIAIASVIFLVSFDMDGNAATIVASALMLVGLGSIGMLVLREPDADWEHTPEFRGFRPVAGSP